MICWSHLAEDDQKHAVERIIKEQDLLDLENPPPDDSFGAPAAAPTRTRFRSITDADDLTDPLLAANGSAELDPRRLRSSPRLVIS